MCLYQVTFKLAGSAWPPLQALTTVAIRTLRQNCQKVGTGHEMLLRLIPMFVTVNTQKGKSLDARLAKQGSMGRDIAKGLE
jgi:hypothetical protein